MLDKARSEVGSRLYTTQLGLGTAEGFQGCRAMASSDWNPTIFEPRKPLQASIGAEKVQTQLLLCLSSAEGDMTEPRDAARAWAA